MATTRFPALEAIPGLSHGFVERVPGLEVTTTDKNAALRQLESRHREAIRDLGFAPARLVTCEQIHGSGLARIDDPRPPVPGVDGLLTDRPGLVLGIHVADCCAVTIADPRTRALAVVHSGKKGTELGIVPKAIQSLATELSARPEDLVVQLSPCIRPPAYEIDFAATIRAEAAAAGVPPARIHDDRTCTTARPDRFYSYRTERGATGRMLMAAGWVE